MSTDATRRTARYPNPVVLAVVTVLTLLLLTPSAAQAISFDAAKSKALEALDVRDGKDPVIVFGSS